MSMFEPLKLIPWQEIVEKAVGNGATRIYIKAGRKSGKSHYCMHRMVRQCFNPPAVSDQVNCFIGPEKTHVKKIYWRRLKDYVCPKKRPEERGQDWEELLTKRPNETELYMDFKSTGIRLSLEGAENEKIIRGWNIGDHVLDEADEMKSGFYDEVVEPNTLATGHTIGMFVGTPKNRWFTKRWRMVKDGLFGKNHVAFQFTPYDNPYISKAKLEEIKNRVSREVWEQEYMANENAYSGLMYSEFENYMVVQHREPRTESRLIRAIDWGWDHPTHVLWGEVWFNKETNRWNLYIYREFSIRGKAVEDVCAAVLSGDTKSYIFTVIDKAAKKHEMTSGRSIIGEFRRYGIPCMTPQLKEDLRINATKMMLKHNEIQISEQCPTLINQLREVEWGQIERDDAADAFKYMSSMVYDRDFTHLTNSGEMQEEKVDPLGIIAARRQMEEGSMVWDFLDASNG